ncbi:MAG: DUF2089 domain-containing protein [Anaerolineae bacterium]|nr:DUF2089 domain-containing protein [Candidatus Roseilinea sp.]MDW8448699.1 DUF2089 domain-containing protein [Anaerolineae bacterium]
MKNLPNQCPICGGGITVTRFQCDQCDVTIEGRFAVSKFVRLSDEQLQFVETFVRCEGKISRMENELGLSYPTIRARLHEVIRALGYEPGKDEGPAAPGLSLAERKRILEDLDQGRITAEQAMKLLSRREE